MRIARTRAKSGPDPVWDEEFVFDDVPCDVVSFTLTVHNKGKRGKDTEVAELHVDLSMLGNGEEKEEWYTLSGLTPMGEWGSLRLRTRYLHDLVMPAEEYSPLQQLLLQPGLASVRTLAEICHADRAPLATALLRVFRAEGRETELLIELNSAEVHSSFNILIMITNIIFRLNEKLKHLLYSERPHYLQHLWICICEPNVEASFKQQF